MQQLGCWQAAIMAAAVSPYKAIGLKPKRNLAHEREHSLQAVAFDLYARSRRTPRESA
jgi:hypothetical protein